MEPEVAACLMLAMVFMLNTAAWLLQRNQLQHVDAKMRTLVQEIAALRSEAAKYNQPSTYAKCAKCQRQMNAKEKELAALVAASSVNTWDTRVQQAIKVFKMLGAGVCVIVFYGRPLLHLPRDLLTPMQGALAFPHGHAFSQYGAVAVVPWLMVCEGACHLLLQAALPPQRKVVLPVKGLVAAASEDELQEGLLDKKVL